MAPSILVIDDQESMRSIISQTLKGNGYMVTTASDGEEGLALFTRNPAAFDLILADVNMPKVDGFEFLRQVKASYSKPPVVFLTGANEDVVETVGKEYKVDGIVEKPFKVDILLGTIKKLLSR